MPYPRAGRPSMCQHCFEPVLAVGVPFLNWPLLLEDNELPITTDLARARPGDVWEWSGPLVGWIEKYGDQRTWRPLRARHDCTTNPKESAR